MSSFADLLTSGHQLLKIIKIQLICSETVEHKLHFELLIIKIDAILTDIQRFHFALPYDFGDKRKVTYCWKRVNKFLTHHCPTVRSPVLNI